MLAAAVAALLLFACTVSRGPVASGTRLTSPSPNAADSKAADLRTRLDLLLGEHVMVIAKESSAAGRADEFAGYLHLLTTNGSDLTDLVRSALGSAASARFDTIWSAQNDNLVNYTIGLVTHNKSKSDAAAASLVNNFVPQLSLFATDTTQVPQGSIAQLVMQHALQTKAVIDDQVGQRYARLYADLHLAYGQASQIGDALAPRIAQKYPDKFPGRASSKAVDLRVSVNALLQEHAYLSTMATSAIAGGRSAEQAAAVAVLTDNTNTFAAMLKDLFGSPAAIQFDQIWPAKNAAVIAYATARAGAARQRARSQLTDVFVPRFSGFVESWTGLSAFTPAIDSQVQATITVIDDQRSKSLSGAAADDRSAEASMELVADLIAAGTVAKLSKRF
ncbi:MAG: hypothetical protein QOI23_921 [Chloroflexota bacterium]|nr:hypothetical protein [Chloroflexota bacterium]